MALVFPVAVDQNLAGSAVNLGTHQDKILLATALHVLGDAQDVQIGIPPHGGDCSRRQTYPIQTFPATPAKIETTDPLADLALLSIQRQNIEGNIPAQDIHPDPDSVDVGDQMVVLGYPFAVIGSTLETWTRTHVSALGDRRVGPDASVEEIVLPMQSHPGISGGPVISREDGSLRGIVRGTLSPPKMIEAGGVEIGTDTSVTFATSAHLLIDLISQITDEENQ